jgi:hypothetical protein
MSGKICRRHNDLWRICCARAALPAVVFLSIRSLLRKAYTVGHHLDHCKLKSACKPGSVESNHSSKDPCRQGPQAAYPEARTNRRCFMALRPKAASLFGLAPRGVYLAVECCHRRGALLPHRFTLTGHYPLPGSDLGGLFSVALSVGSRPPGVTWHVIRGSPDFPPRPNRWNAAIARPTSPATIRSYRSRLNCIASA